MITVKQHSTPREGQSVLLAWEQDNKVVVTVLSHLTAINNHSHMLTAWKMSERDLVNGRAAISQWILYTSALWRQEREKHRARISGLHHISVVMGIKRYTAAFSLLAVFRVRVTPAAVPACAENMDPQCPDEQEEHGHADVESGKRNLSSR